MELASPPRGFVTINADMLTSWKYRDLQQLCKQLGIGGKGSRAQLVQRLQEWNRTNREADGDRQCNVKPHNFALMGVRCFRQEGDKHLLREEISPRLLSPLVNRHRTRRPGETPSSILKSGKRGAKSEKRINFSLYNGVQLIPNRLDFAQM